MATKRIPPPLPHLDPDRPQREILIDAIWGVTEGMRGVLIHDGTKNNGREGTLASFLGGIGAMWYSKPPTPTAVKTDTADAPTDALESARKALEGTLTGHFHSGEADNRAFVERFVPWLISSSMLTFIQLLTLQRTELWLSDATSANRIKLPFIVQRQRSDLFRWIAARAELPPPLRFFRRALDVGRYVVLDCVMKATVHKLITTAALARRVDGVRQKNAYWEWRMFGIMQDHVDDLAAYHRTPARFRELISKAPDDGDIGALIRVNVENEIAEKPDYAAGREIFDKITTTTRNTEAMRTLRDWLKRERYTDASYIAENMNNKRPRLASVETREFLD